VNGLRAVKGFGWLTTAFGVFACLMVLLHLGEQTASDATIRFIVSAVLAAVGAVIVRRARPVVPPVNVQRVEFEILRSARARAGRVTATEIAVDTALPVAMATEILEGLSRRGACRMSIAEAGIVVYEFPELEARGPAAAAAAAADGESEDAAQARRAASRQDTTS
jgi:hypothetical protein